MTYNSHISPKAQKVFLSLAIVSCILASLSWLSLLRQTYPGGQSNIDSIGIWTILLLPYVLFMGTYLICRFIQARSSRIFVAAILTMVGMLVVSIVERLLSAHIFIADDIAEIAWIIVPTLTAYLGLVLYFKSTHLKKPRLAELMLVIMASVAYLIESGFILYGLFTHYGTSLQEPNSAYNIITALIPVILPPLYTGLAYFIVKFNGPIYERLKLAVIVAIMGQMIGGSLLVFYSLLARVSSDISMFFLMADTRVVIMWLSVAVYVAMILWLRRSLAVDAGRNQ